MNLCHPIIKSVQMGTLFQSQESLIDVNPVLDPIHSNLCMVKCGSSRAAVQVKAYGHFIVERFIEQLKK